MQTNMPYEIVMKLSQVNRLHNKSHKKEKKTTEVYFFIYLIFLLLLYFPLENMYRPLFPWRTTINK